MASGRKGNDRKPLLPVTCHLSPVARLIMLFLLFQLGNDRYALEANRVVEIVPLLSLKAIPQAPKGVAGLLVYRGRAIPALDLCDLTFGRPARERMSTRIIIVNYSEATGHNQSVKWPSPPSKPPSPPGELAERGVEGGEGATTLVSTP